MPRFCGRRQPARLFSMACCKSQTMGAQPISLAQAPQNLLAAATKSLVFAWHFPFYCFYPYERLEHPRPFEHAAGYHPAADRFYWGRQHGERHRGWPAQPRVCA